MDECTLKEYCDKDCKSCILAKEIKYIAEVNEAIENIKNAIIEAFAPVVERASKAFCGMWDAIKYSHPNKRVVHLAQKGKKARTRKKNTNRISKDILREMGNKNNGRT